MMPLGSLPGYSLAGRSYPPYSEEPYPIEPPSGEPVEERVRDVVEGRPWAYLGEQDLCVDLVEGWIHPPSIALRCRAAKANTGLLKGGRTPAGLIVRPT